MTSCKALVPLAAAGLLVVNLAVASPKSITLPADSAQLRSSPLPGFALAQANCTACHSAEYMLYQPPNAGRPYWDAMTRRMQTVFKAPLNDADIAPIVDYLTATYGTQGK
jgi:mono/diheme cytochrome c family protein